MIRRPYLDISLSVFSKVVHFSHMYYLVSISTIVVFGSDLHLRYCTNGICGCLSKAPAFVHVYLALVFALFVSQKKNKLFYLQRLWHTLAGQILGVFSFLKSQIFDTKALEEISLHCSLELAGVS